MIKKGLDFLIAYIYYYVIIRFKNRKIKIYDDEKTIKILKEKKLSYSRFGDGEFKWILDINQNSFQNQNYKMSEELKEILISNNENLLVGIPISLKSLRHNKFSAIRYWVTLYKGMNNKILSIIDINKYYGNSSVTRPYMDFKNINFENKFNNLKSLWDNKKILIIEGELTKLGVNNNLFDNTKEIKRIICPAQNAYDKIDEIEYSVKNVKYNFDLCLIALGPTATILASRLSKNNIQAIDIGHVDIEYEWYLQSAKKKVNIIGKYTNEGINGVKYIKDEHDLVEYKKQIIKEVGVEDEV